MNGILVLVGRLFAILVGYALAVLAASVFLHLIWSSDVGWTGQEPSRLVVGSMAVSAGFLALMFANFAFVPAAMAIGLSEAFGWRDWLTYALAGAAVAVVVTAAGRYGIEGSVFVQGSGPPRPRAGVPGGTGAFVETIAAGLVGGIAYWLVAGRGAGSWRRAPRARIPPMP